MTIMGESVHKAVSGHLGMLVLDRTFKSKQ